MQKAKAANNLEYVRVALQREFIDRCKKNASYSLRAYANFLEIDQSFLSKLLKGQRRVTEDLAKSVGPRLGIKPQKMTQIFTSGTAAMPGFLSLSDDEFELLSNWHHFAILELTKTKNFNADATSIAARLNIHVEEVRAAVERLSRLGFISVIEGEWKLLAPNTTFTNTTTSTTARRVFQKTLIEKSLHAIDHIPFDLRENGSLTIAINKDRIPEFKEKLKQVRKELSEFFQPDGETDLDEVYQLTVALFPLTKIKDI